MDNKSKSMILRQFEENGVNAHFELVPYYYKIDNYVTNYMKSIFPNTTAVFVVNEEMFNNRSKSVYVEKEKGLTLVDTNVIVITDSGNVVKMAASEHFTMTK